MGKVQLKEEVTFGKTRAKLQITSTWHCLSC